MAGNSGALTIQPIKTVIKNKCHYSGTHTHSYAHHKIKKPRFFQAFYFSQTVSKNKTPPKEGGDKCLFLLQFKKYYTSKLTQNKTSIRIYKSSQNLIYQAATLQLFLITPFSLLPTTHALTHILPVSSRLIWPRLKCCLGLSCVPVRVPVLCFCVAFIVKHFVS